MKGFKEWISLKITLIVMSLFWISSLYAITIAPNTLITTDTTYNHETINLSQGSFIIKNNATLTLNDCMLRGTLSAKRPQLFHVVQGNLKLNRVNGHFGVSGVTPNPLEQATMNVIKLDQGNVQLGENYLVADDFFSINLLMTNERFANKGFVAHNNVFKNFHGGLFLVNDRDANIRDNRFYRVSYANIFHVGHHATIAHNEFIFPGNLQVGDAVFILDSNFVEIDSNYFASAANSALAIVESRNIRVIENKMHDGLSYAINIYPPEMKKDPQVANLIHKYRNRHVHQNEHIIITQNHLGQNRYGIAAFGVYDLMVVENLFVQRFPDALTRQFWTDNNNLLTQVMKLFWQHNYYKEAYTQLNDEENAISKTMVLFPEKGGVVL